MIIKTRKHLMIDIKMWLSKDMHRRSDIIQSGILVLLSSAFGRVLQQCNSHFWIRKAQLSILFPHFHKLHYLLRPDEKWILYNHFIIKKIFVQMKGFFLHQSYLQTGISLPTQKISIKNKAKYYTPRE